MSANNYTTGAPTTHTTHTTSAAPVTHTTHTTHTTGTTATDPTTTHTTHAANHGEAAGQGLKGMFAKGHGVGESIRGNINSAIDGFTGDKASLAKNEQVARGGEREFQTGHFEKRGTTDKAL